MIMPIQKPGRSIQDYRTPEIFIERVKELLKIDSFSHDFAASATNAQSASWTNIEIDAFSYLQDWRKLVGDGWGWLNPPFSNIKPWAQRCLDLKNNGGKVVLLVPASVGSNWFKNYVDGHAFVVFLNGRLAFMTDKPKWLYPKDCMLCIYSKDWAPGHAVWDWKHHAGYPGGKPK